MLYTDTLEPAALELLKSLQSRSYLKGFYLVGGTALALFWGHRKSVDLDLFTHVGFDAENMLEQISQDFPYKIQFSAFNTLKGSINNMKVDIIAHRYPLIDEPYNFDDITLLSVQDILAMKLNAISISGQRSKDFVDIWYALNQFTLEEMLSFYKKKYNQDNTSHILKSLIYFDDVDLSDWPVLLKDPGLKWKDITMKIESVTMQYIKDKM
jgi:hypothetical protein